MLRIDKVIKSWKESAALNDHINLYGQWSENTFLTKSGDLGMVLRVTGVDYESLDHASQEYAVKRLEAALKSFGPGFNVYQYLFKSNRPEIPFADYAILLSRQRSTIAASSSARNAKAYTRSTSFTAFFCGLHKRRQGSVRQYHNYFGIHRAHSRS